MTLTTNLYLGFDKAFFRSTANDRLSLIEMLRYKKLLMDNAELLNRVLANQADPSELSDDFYKELQDLILSEKRHDTHLRNPTDGNPLKITIDDLVKTAGVQLSENQQKYLNGRVGCHLARLMSPVEYAMLDIPRRREDIGLGQKIQNTVCMDFGKELIQYLASLSNPALHDIYDQIKITDVIGGKGDGAFLFWTIAPYIHLELKQRGLTSQQSMKRLFDWISDAYIRMKKSSELEFENNFAYTSSIEPMLITPTRYYQLGYDERMPSHLLARLIAKYAAAELQKSPLQRLLDNWDTEIHPPYWHKKTPEESLGRLVEDTFFISGLPNRKLSIPARQWLSDVEFYELMLDAYRHYVEDRIGHEFIPVRDHLRRQFGWISDYKIDNRAYVSFEVDSDKHYIQITVYANKGEQLQARIAEITKSFIIELGLRQTEPPKPFGY